MSVTTRLNKTLAITSTITQGNVSLTSNPTASDTEEMPSSLKDSDKTSDKNVETGPYWGTIMVTINVVSFVKEKRCVLRQREGLGESSF